MKIVPATLDDIPALKVLIQNSYRGPVKGWTCDHQFLQGQRVSDEMLRDDLTKPGALFLKGVSDEGELIGCVFVDKHDDNFLFCGTLCVQPQLQNCGLGKKLMGVVEDVARTEKCDGVKIHVVIGRTTLVEWYERQGFKQTGEREPFPDTNCYGVPTMPLEFIVMKKFFELE
ncbi:unnamed protein product [Orchesella dallaii]|uniref:N-acetyltransferase domain-containing protein n=1 Tax=Orchesella dallaii TaxID=48710 RepID=A0ABP1REJ8_9HEXA